MIVNNFEEQDEIISYRSDNYWIIKIIEGINVIMEVELF